MSPPLPICISRNFTNASSMNTSRMPVSEKSMSVVKNVALATGSSPRAASTASALLRMVPPTQKPRALICSAPVMFCTTSMAAMAPSST
ncbi:hypothetical protein D3C72_2368130 [compost metagenome]